MSIPRFRNCRGESIAPVSLTATVAKNEFGRVLDLAERNGAVVITKHDAPRAVLLSIDEYNALIRVPEATLEALTRRFDGMIADMQRPGAGARMQAAFSASPKQLGAAAVAAARKRA